MDRHTHTQRLGWHWSRGIRSAAVGSVLAAAVLAAGCATAPEMENSPIPYIFSVSSYKDSRTDAAQLPDVPQAVFLRALLNHLNGSVFGSRPATLKVDLKNITLTQDDKFRRHLTALVNLTALNEYGETLAEGDFSCHVNVEGQGFDPLGASGKMVGDIEHPPAAGPRLNEAGLTEALKVCSKQLAQRLGGAILE